MKINTKSAVAIITASLAAMLVMAFAAQDKYSVTAPNGVSFSEFRGYESWENVAVSVTEDAMNAILANPVMIKAYKDGIPGNGKPFPDGCMTVKIEWKKKTNGLSPYFVEVPDTLNRVSFILKDTKRFPDSSGWGYAQFLHDAGSNTFRPFGADKDFGTKVCFECHKAAKATDYIFTGYPRH